MGKGEVSSIPVSNLLLGLHAVEHLQSKEQDTRYQPSKAIKVWMKHWLLQEQIMVLHMARYKTIIHFYFKK